MLIHALILPIVLAGHSPAVLRMPGASTATDTIVVGHAVLRAASPAMGTDTTEIFVERDGKRQLVSTGIEKVSRTSDGILVVYESQSRRGAMLDSITMTPGAFAPTRHVEAFPGKRATLTYRGGRLTGTSTDSTGEHAVDVAVGTNRFDFSVLTLITRALPAKAGYEAVILTYDISPMQERAVTYRVVGEDHITWHGGDVTAWKTITDFGTHQVTRWMDARTRRDLQWEIKSPAMHMIGVTK